MTIDSSTLHLHIVDVMLKAYELPFKRVEQFAEDDAFAQFFDSFKIFETSIFDEVLHDNRISRKFINFDEFHLFPNELVEIDQSQYKPYLYAIKDGMLLQSMYSRLMKVADDIDFYERRQLELWEDFVASKKEALSEQTDENDYLID